MLMRNLGLTLKYANAKAVEAAIPRRKPSRLKSDFATDL